MTKTVNCNCQHEFQDKEHGKGKRVANKSNKTENTYTCTVCGKQHKAKD